LFGSNFELGAAAAAGVWWLRWGSGAVPRWAAGGGCLVGA